MGLMGSCGAYTAVSELGDVLAGLALDMQAVARPPIDAKGAAFTEEGSQKPSEADAAAAELARLALAQPSAAAGATAAASSASAARGDTKPPGRSRVAVAASSSNAQREREPLSAPAGRLRRGAAQPADTEAPLRPAAAAAAAAPIARRRSGRASGSGRLSAAAGQENRRNSGNVAPPPDGDGQAGGAKAERGLAGTVEAPSSQVAAAPAKGAAKRVAAMRQFWEATAQKEVRPRAGAQGLPHRSLGQLPARAQAPAANSM